MVRLEAVRSSDFRRDTVHRHFNGGAFGVPLFTKLIPLKLKIRLPGGYIVTRVLVYKPITRKNMPYSDLGEVEKCCLKVYTFNIRHYLKCYLTGNTDGPYTFNLCERCGVAIKDANGHSIQQTLRRKYRRDAYVWQPANTLQNKAGTGEIFNYQERVL